MILIRVVRCMMPGWGAGGLGSVTLRKQSGIRNPEPRQPLPQSPPHHPASVPEPEALALSASKSGLATRTGLALPGSSRPLRVHWAWGGAPSGESCDLERQGQAPSQGQEQRLKLDQFSGGYREVVKQERTVFKTVSDPHPYSLEC